MGKHVIHVEAVGAHHNAENPGDADRLARKLVADLKAAGHSIQSAHFFTDSGTSDDLIDEPATPAPSEG